MQDAFATYLEEQGTDVFAAAYGITRDAEDAKDAVQDALLTAYLKLDQCSSPENLPNWVRTITLNSARNVLRQKHKELPAYDMGELDANVAVALEEEPDLDRLAAVREALAAVTEEEAQLLFRHHAQSQSILDLAEEASLPAGTMSSRLSRARDKLVPELAQRSMEVLAELWGQTFSPQPFAHTRLIQVRPQYSRGDRVYVMASTNGANTFMLTVRPAEVVTGGEGLNGTGTGGLVLDQHALRGYTASRIHGSEVEEVDWNLGFLEALKHDQPIAITKNLLDLASIGSPMSQQRWRDLADQVWERLMSTSNAEQAAQLEAELASSDVERCLAASSSLLHQRVTAPVAERLQGLSCDQPEHEAKRLAALGFVARRAGERAQARGLFLEAQKRQKGYWEWSYHLAEAQSFLGDYRAAAASVVQALKRDPRGGAYMAIRSNPLLRGFLSVSRLWQLLPKAGEARYPTRTFLPCVAAWTKHSFQAKAPD